MLTLLLAAAVAHGGSPTAGGPVTGQRPYLHQRTVFRDFLKSGGPCQHCPEMATIPPGHFFMGSWPGQGHNDEQGPHGRMLPVRIGAELAFSVGEITRREFAAYMAVSPEGGSEIPCAGYTDGAFNPQAGDGWRNPGFPQDPSHPVVCVSWRMAKGYADWLSRITDQRYRLPSEAEWEYATRAGSRGRYWWGEAYLPDRINCVQARCDTRFAQTAPSRSFPANAFGLYDVLGNVWEWTLDCYEADAYRERYRQYPAPVVGRPECMRVIRGGSWSDGFWSARSANREGWKPDTPLNDIGFRVVREGSSLPL